MTDVLFLLFCARRDEESAKTAADRGEDASWYQARAAGYRSDVAAILEENNTP